MKEKIMDNKSFNITIDDVKYRCVITTNPSSSVHKVFHYIQIYKIISKKFIFWKYSAYKYIDTQIIGDSDYVKYDYHNGSYYYNIDDVKIYSKQAIDRYQDKCDSKKHELEKVNNYKIVNEIN